MVFQSQKMNPSSSSSSKRKRNPISYDDDAVEPICKRPKNDVFLNFSEDIGKSFVRHLHGALSRHSFTTVDHMTRLPTGQDVCSELLKAIEESEIYVIVFSINYAFSERCLDELIHIMDFRKSDQRKVLPVFFKVEPSDVRKQQGSFEKAFKAHETNFDSERVQKWRQTLKEAGGLSGHNLQNGDEEMFVCQIVEELEKMQNPQKLHVTDHPAVGIGSRVQELISNLNLDSEDVSIVAVLGISGIGKTTIVKAAYNRIAAKFDVCCFLADIYYHYRSPNWKVQLQKELISCLNQNDKLPIIHGHNDGVTKILKLISHRKVLLVLDDVDNFEQLKALGIHPGSFYGGSKIIVTTRDKHALRGLPYITYNVSLLDDTESFELFTRLTFEKDDPIDKMFVEEIVYCAAGLPLVLEVWSQHFKDHEREQWESVLETLKRIPHNDVQMKLRMSYDALSNRAKKLFLDIACFFDGLKKDTAVKVLQDEDSAFFPENEIGYLVDKCLVKYELLGGSEVLKMHHAIKEMGLEIVRQENEDEPGERSRLWDSRDVVGVLRECSGTNKVQSISLYYWENEEEVTTHDVQVEALRKMSNLRLIQFHGKLCWSSCSNDDDNNMPNSVSLKKLKYLEWYHFPFKCINSTIDMGNVVVVVLQYSKLEILWEGMKTLKKLRILHVSHSRSLTKTGDFYGLENLEELNFDCCENLQELHSSVGCLDKLAILNLSYCNVSQVPREFGNLVALQTLELSGNTFSSLPDSFNNLSQLVRLNISDCYRLRSLPLVPPKLKRVEATGCGSLDVMAFVKMTCISVSEVYKMFHSNCGLHIKISGDEVPTWRSYRHTGQNLSFVAPMMHLEKKICGMIFGATTWNYGAQLSPKIVNKTKETSYLVKEIIYNSLGGMSLFFLPLDDTTLVVEAGDTVVLQFIGEGAVSDEVKGHGLRLIYEGDGEDSSLVFPNHTQPTYTTCHRGLLPFPSHC